MRNFRFRPRNVLVFAVLATALFSAVPSQAGLIRQERVLEGIYYLQTEILRLDDQTLREQWSDQIDYVDLRARRGASILSRTFAGADGKPLLVTMLDARPACGLSECPLRVYSGQGALLLDASACDETSAHFMAVDRKSLMLCGVRHELSPLAAKPVPANQSRSMWHNGSVVQASFRDNGEVDIRYVRPRDGLPQNLRGQLLFEGRIEGLHFLAGTAYTFKAGCAPAAYAVTGSIDNRSHIALAGQSPRRDPRSCAVVGFTRQSPNARLDFVDVALSAD